MCDGHPSLGDSKAPYQEGDPNPQGAFHLWPAACTCSGRPGASASQPLPAVGTLAAATGLAISSLGLDTCQVSFGLRPQTPALAEDPVSYPEPCDIPSRLKLERSSDCLGSHHPQATCHHSAARPSLWPPALLGLLVGGGGAIHFCVPGSLHLQPFAVLGGQVKATWEEWGACGYHPDEPLTLRLT